MAKSSSASDRPSNVDTRGRQTTEDASTKDKGNKVKQSGFDNNGEKVKKKKRKRVSEGEEKEKEVDELNNDIENEEHHANGRSDGERAEKRTKKKHKKIPSQTQFEPEPEQPAPTSTPAETTHPKKKKRKNKGKQRASTGDNDEVPIDPELSNGLSADAGDELGEGSNGPSSAAFLTAVVAAASATSDPQNQAQTTQDSSIGEGTENHLDFPTFPAYPFPNIPANYVPPEHHQPILYPETFSGALVPPTHNASSSASTADAFGLSDAAILETLGLNLSSNEEMLRSLQELDYTKITSILRSLGDAASASMANATFPNLTPGPSAASSSTSRPPSAARAKPAPRQTSVPSAMLLGQPSRNSEKAQLSPAQLSANLANSAHQVDPDHQLLLANKWMSATKLGELAKAKGFVYKKGKFSTSEEHQLKNAIETYRFNKGLSFEELNDIIFAKGTKSRDNQFWSEITSSIPGRPIIAVYHHVRRSHHPLKQQGKWMPAEDESLIQAVADCGQQWEKVSDRVGRMAGDCRDRWRNHLSHRATRTHGQWSKEEEDHLTQIVTNMTIAQGKDQDNDVFWGIVAQQMGNRRSRQQCRIKWTDSLSKLVKNEGQRPRWSPQDGYILVHKIASLSVNDDSEIDWKTIPDDDWNLWSAHSLQRRWLTLKRSIKGHEDMTHQEIIDILRVKKAHIPPAPSASRKSRVTSSATITEPTAADHETNSHPLAGPSTHIEAGPVAAVNINAATEEVDEHAHTEKEAGEDIGSSSEEEEVEEGVGEVSEREKLKADQGDGQPTPSPSSSEDEDEDESSSSDSE